MRPQIWNLTTTWRDYRPHNLSPFQEQMELNQSHGGNIERFAWILLASSVKQTAKHKASGY